MQHVTWHLKLQHQHFFDTSTRTSFQHSKSETCNSATRNMSSRSRSRSDTRGRTRSRSPYSDRSADKKDSRSPSRARRTVSPRDVSRSPRQNGRNRSVSRSISRDRSASPVRSTKVHCRRQYLNREAADILQVVIEKLTKNVTKEHLEEIFGAYGQIRDMDLPLNRNCTRSC